PGIPLLAPVRHHDVIQLSPLTRSKRSCGRYRQRIESDPSTTSTGSKSRSAAVPNVLFLSLGSTGGAGSETARFHHAARRRGGGVAPRGARAAAGDAGDRIS